MGSKNKKKRKANEITITCKYKKCGKTFVWHHASRKYCPNSNCKDCFWNEINKEVEDRHKFLVKISEKNYVVLDAAYRNGISEISMERLEHLGLKFDAFFKHDFTPDQLNQRHGDTYCYSGYSLKNLGNRNFQIIKQNPAKL